MSCRIAPIRRSALTVEADRHAAAFPRTDGNDARRRDGPGAAGRRAPVRVPAAGAVPGPGHGVLGPFRPGLRLPGPPPPRARGAGVREVPTGEGGARPPGLPPGPAGEGPAPAGAAGAIRTRW